MKKAAKKILLFVLICLGTHVQFLEAGAFDNGNDQAKNWAAGFDACLLSLGREYRIQGVKPKSVFFKKYMIYVDASSYSSQHKLLIQQFGFDGVLEPVRLDGGWIVFGSYDYLPDAEALKTKLLSKFFDDGGIQVKIYENIQNKMFLTEKTFYESIAIEIEKEIKQNVPVMVIEKPVTQAPLQIESKPIIAPPVVAASTKAPSIEPKAALPAQTIQREPLKENDSPKKTAFFDNNKAEEATSKSSKEVKANSSNPTVNENTKLREFVLLGDKVERFKALSTFQNEPTSKKLRKDGSIVNEGQILQTGYQIALKDTGIVMVKINKQNAYIPMEFISFVD